MGVKVANNAVTTTVGAVSSIATSVSVASGTGALFPILGSGDYFYATLTSTAGVREVVKVTARTDDGMTIVRGQEGTIAQAFPATSRFELRITAASITDMIAEHDQASEITFTPTGGIAATNVQSAIAELDGEAVKLADLASMATGKGAALVGTTLGITEEAVNNSLVMHAPWLGAAGDGTDCVAVVNTYLATKTRLHFPARVGARATSRYGISSPILITQNGTHISFDKGARLVPFNGVDPGGGIRVVGAAPTAFTNLSADASQGGNTFIVATDPGWQVGDWVELRSDALIADSPNFYAKNKIGVGRKIAARSGTGPVTYTVDASLMYDFRVSDNARVGKCTMIENVIIDCAQLNDEDFGSNILSFPIYLKYCANVTILNPTAYGSKLPYAPDIATGDFIKIWNCVNVNIYNPFMRHGGYYGLSITGWTENLFSDGGVMEDVRHAVSVVYVDPAFGDNGQPVNIQINGMTARYTSLAAFDTHDTGVNILFTNCLSDGAGDDGFQARNWNVRYENCTAINSFFDGFSHNTMGTVDYYGNTTVYGIQAPYGCKAVNCVSTKNGRLGVHWQRAHGSWTGGLVSDNRYAGARGGAKAGGTGFSIHSGLIDGARIENNGGTSAILFGDGTNGQGPLLVANCAIPYSATQTSAIGTPTTAGYDLSLATLRNNEITGYGDRMFQNSGTVKNVSPTTSGNQITSTGSLRKGRATLVAGTVTVANTAVRNKAAAAFGEAILSNINLRVVTPGGTTGALVVSIVDATSFTIKSSSALDTSVVEWTMDL